MILVRLLFFLMVGVAISASAESNNRSTYIITKISDGDSLLAGAKRLRLFGIDAPELEQACKNNYGHKYACGEVAKTALKELISNGNTLSCNVVDVDRYRRLVARCFTDDIDLSKWLVREGLAIAYLAYSKEYYEAEIEARNEQRGMWKGTFMEPSKWRRAKRSNTLPENQIIR